MPLSYTRKAYYEALIAICKRFGIKDYILSITTNNYIMHKGICERFKKHAFKSAEDSFDSQGPPLIFKAEDSYICYIAHLINLLA